MIWRKKNINIHRFVYSYAFSTNMVNRMKFHLVEMHLKCIGSFISDCNDKTRNQTLFHSLHVLSYQTISQLSNQTINHLFDCISYQRQFSITHETWLVSIFHSTIDSLFNDSSEKCTKSTRIHNTPIAKFIDLNSL